MLAEREYRLLFVATLISSTGDAIAGPIALAVGNDGALWLAVAAIVACNVTMLAMPAVWTIRRPQPDVARTVAA